MVLLILILLKILLNLQSIGWNVRSYDTSIKDVEKIKQRVVSQLKPGAIIFITRPSGFYA